ncbi:MAG: GYD family protein [Chloroflexi bacterium]|nr:GYD family protein [Chloroflexota bacterium]
MPVYLTRFSYTPETWARLINKPEDRRKAAQSYIESLSLAITSGGAVSSLETTVLLTVEETLEALRKAKGIQYRPPGA